MKGDWAASRRVFLGRVLGLAVATGVMGSLEATAWAAGEGARAEDERVMWQFLDGIAIGEAFYGEWVLLDAYPPIAGGVTLLVARGDGAPIRVDLCRRAEEVRAPAFTRFLELYIMDGGGGVGHVPEDMIEALQALAERLQDNESQWRLAERLLTHPERVARYPEFMARAAKELQPVRP